MYSIGIPELVLILVIALVVFGPGKLPEIGKAVGKSLREFRSASTEDNTKTIDAKNEDEKKDSTEVKRDNQAIAITSVIITLVGIFIMFEVSALVGMIIYLIAFALSFNELRKDPEFRPETIVPFAKKCLSKENFKGMGLMFLVVAILPLMAVIGSYRWIVTDTYREVESMYNDYY